MSAGAGVVQAGHKAGHGGVAVVIIHGSTGVTLKDSQGSLMLINVLYYALLCVAVCVAVSLCLSVSQKCIVIPW